MRALVCDEIASPDLERLRERLGASLAPSALPDVFWLPLPAAMLSPLQREHATICGPYRLAVVLDDDAVRVELLVRPRESLHCACAAYATGPQRDYALEFLDGLLAELAIRT